MFWAKETGLDISTVTIVPLSPLDLPEAMNSGRIDAMAGSEPWPVNVENLCKDKVHQLADFSGLGNTFPHVLVVTDKLATRYPGDVKKLVRAITRAAEYIRNNSEKTAEITSKYTGLSIPDQVRCTARLSWEIGWTEQDFQSIQKTAEFLKDFGKISEIPDMVDFINTSYIGVSGVKSNDYGKR
jgi:ABC-type nitrate/sulfonate/bicarbonate transport system substrate-binding protein